MSKFAYKMQSILDIKYKMESQAKLAFANANQEVERQELKLKVLYDDINRYERKIVELYNDKLDIQELKNCVNSIEIKKLHIKAQKLEVNKAKKKLEIARIKLNDVMVERKTHEKLKDKAFEKFLEEEKVAETKEIDELVSYTHTVNEKPGE